MKQTIIWISALVIGAILGLVGINWIDETATFLANIYTRLFQLVAVPTIVLAVTTTLATLSSKGTGRIFAHTLSYTHTHLNTAQPPMHTLSHILPQKLLDTVRQKHPLAHFADTAEE